MGRGGRAAVPPLQLVVAGGARQFQRGWPKVMVLGREVANFESEGGGGRRPFLEEGRREFKSKGLG